MSRQGRDHGDGMQSPPRLIRSQPKKKKRRDKTSPETASDRRKKAVSFGFDAWIPAAWAVGSLVVYATVAANIVPQGLDASTYFWNKLGFILTVIVICAPLLLAASALMGICYGELKTVLVQIPAIVLTQAWAEDLLTLQPLPYVPTLAPGR